MSTCIADDSQDVIDLEVRDGLATGRGLATPARQLRSLAGAEPKPCRGLIEECRARLLSLNGAARSTSVTTSAVTARNPESIDVTSIMEQGPVAAAAATGRRRLRSTVGAWNAPSLRVLEKVGFRRDHTVTDDRGEVVYLVRDLQSDRPPDSTGPIAGPRGYH